MRPDSENWSVLADLRVLEALANDARLDVGLVRQLEALLPTAASLSPSTRWIDDADAAIARLHSEPLLLVGVHRYTGFGSGSHPRDIGDRITDLPYATVSIRKGTYHGVYIGGGGISGVHRIMRCTLHGPNDGTIAHPASRAGLADLERADATAADEERHAAERARSLRDEADRRYLEQRAASTSVSVAWGSYDSVGDDDDAEPAIEQLHHRDVMDRAVVVWEWWVPDGSPSGGPMTREYADVVVRWEDGEYYYLQVGEGAHELVPLGRYEHPDEAIGAAKRHSLYSDEERDGLDGSSL